MFTSFTTVGYGDIRGYTVNEMLVQILVTMIGICLFSWMSAIIKEIIDNFKVRDFNDENADLIDNWLFKLDKVRTEVLPKAIINLVRDFFTKKFKYDPTLITNNEMFEKLKPRLKKLIYDLMQEPLRQKFHFLLHEFEPNFQRELFMHVRFVYLPNLNEADEFYEFAEK